MRKFLALVAVLLVALLAPPARAGELEYLHADALARIPAGVHAKLELVPELGLLVTFPDGYDGLLGGVRSVSIDPDEFVGPAVFPTNTVDVCVSGFNPGEPFGVTFPWRGNHVSAQWMPGRLFLADASGAGCSVEPQVGYATGLAAGAYGVLVSYYRDGLWWQVVGGDRGVQELGAAFNAIYPEAPARRLVRGK